MLCLVQQREDGSSGVGASSCRSGCKQRGLRAQVVDFTSGFELNNRSSLLRMLQSCSLSFLGSTINSEDQC